MCESNFASLKFMIYFIKIQKKLTFIFATNIKKRESPQKVNINYGVLINLTRLRAIFVYFYCSIGFLTDPGTEKVNNFYQLRLCIPIQVIQNKIFILVHFVQKYSCIFSVSTNCTKKDFYRLIVPRAKRIDRHIGSLFKKNQTG